MKRKLLIGLAGCGVAVGVIMVSFVMHSTAGERPALRKNADASAVMTAKLEHSQQLLEGLVTEDFGRVLAAAEKLEQISRDADWPTVHGDPVYTHFSVEFQRLAEKLMRMSEQRNLEGAAYTYQNLTATCISCHQHVRNIAPLAVAPQN